MSTIAGQPIHATSIRQGLRQFAALPDWLIAATDPDTFCAALGRAVPELVAGELAITECDIGYIRIKRDVWVGVYELTLSDRQSDQPRTVALRGMILPPTQPDPDLARADASPSQPAFGDEGWRAYVPELRV